MKYNTEEIICKIENTRLFFKFKIKKHYLK